MNAFLNVLSTFDLVLISSYYLEFMFLFFLKLFSGPQTHLFKFMVTPAGLNMTVLNGEELAVN